ncbi:hypothetical protein L345_10770, partial [Ophiophagus hannah]
MAENKGVEKRFGSLLSSYPALILQGLQSQKERETRGIVPYRVLKYVEGKNDKNFSIFEVIFLACAGAQQPGSAICYPCSADLADAAEGSVARVPRAWEHTRQLFPMQGMGNFRLGRRTVMYTVETIPKGKNRVLGLIAEVALFSLSVHQSIKMKFIVSGCLSIGAEKSPTECAVKGSQAMNIISAIFALLGILSFIVDLSRNGPFRSDDNYKYSLVMAILIDPNTVRTDNEIPSVESSIHCPPSSNDIVRKSQENGKATWKEEKAKPEQFLLTTLSSAPGLFTQPLALPHPVAAAAPILRRRYCQSHCQNNQAVVKPNNIHKDHRYQTAATTEFSIVERQMPQFISRLFIVKFLLSVSGCQPPLKAMWLTVTGKLDPFGQLVEEHWWKSQIAELHTEEMELLQMPEEQHWAIQGPSGLRSLH